MTGTAYLGTFAGRSTLVYPTAHDTRTSFTARSPTLTRPTDSIVPGLRHADSATRLDVQNSNSLARIAFIGTDAENETLAFTVIGWQQESVSKLWVPQELLNGTATLGSVSATVLGATVFFADTVTLAAGEGLEGSAFARVIAPGARPFSSVLLDILDTQMLEVQLHRNSSAASVNAIVSAF